MEYEIGIYAILKNDGDWWIGWIEEVPGVNVRRNLETS